MEFLSLLFLCYEYIISSSVHYVRIDIDYLEHSFVLTGISQIVSVLFYSPSFLNKKTSWKAGGVNRLKRTMEP
jgi:hypothetical protein